MAAVGTAMAYTVADSLKTSDGQAARNSRRMRGRLRGVASSAVAILLSASFIVGLSIGQGPFGCGRKSPFVDVLVRASSARRF